jgi:small-conductance mechanosensitive channel
MCRLSRALGIGLAWLLALGHGAVAQQIPAAPNKPNPTPSETEGQTLWGFFSAKTPYEFWLTCAILLAGLAFAYLAVTFLRQIHRQQLESATRAMTILFVIIATMVLITAGYNNEQIAPAFGLFGTIVGYILGKGAQPAPQIEGAPDEGEIAPQRGPSKTASSRASSRRKSGRG